MVSERLSVESYLEQMSIREKIGQLLMARPYTEASSRLDDADRRAITELYVGTIGGPVIGSDERSPKELATYLDRLQHLAGSAGLGIPLLVNADFEYGVGQKSSEATEFPQAMGLGATRSTEHARESARITAREARSLGVHWNNAPNADVNTNPDNPVIGWRSFGDEPELVGDMVEAQVRGYRSAGLLATVGHFPGHGAAADDSHSDLPRLDCHREEIESTHVRPFRRAIEAGADVVMTGHVVVDYLDADRPASLSSAVHRLLRERLGFDGVVVTDSLRMDAITDEWTMDEAALTAIQAGADVAMTLCSFETLVEVSDRLVEAVETGELSRARVDEAVRRVLDLKLTGGPFQMDRTLVDPDDAAGACGAANSRETAEHIARNSITLAKNDDVLPFPDQFDGSIVVVGLQSESLAKSIEDRTSDGCRVRSAAADERIPSADRILVSSDGHDDLVAAVTDRDVPVVVIESGTPYATATYRSLPDAILLAYDTTFTWALDRSELVRQAAVDVIFGYSPRGRLPVTVDDCWPFGHGLTYTDDDETESIAPTEP